MAGYSLQQLQTMGAKPVGGMTAAQLTSQGAKQISPGMIKQAQQNSPFAPPKMPTTDNPQYQETPSTQGATGAFKVAQGLGVAKLGMGLATAERVATGQTQADLNTQNQGIPQQMALLGQLHTMVVNKVPANDPKRIQLENTIRQQAQGTQNQSTQAQIDPGTQLSNREVIGSAVSTAGLIAGSGDIPGMNPSVANPSLLSGGERVLQAAGTGIKTGGIIGATQGLGSGLQNNQMNAGQVASQTVKSGLTGAAIGGATGATVSAVQEGVNALKTPANAELNKITDTISPKMTAKETKLALSQGRLVEGQNPGLLTNGTPDTVIPSDKVNKAAQTIQEQIPGASKMSQPQLFKALNENGVAIRDSLTPVMEQTPVTPTQLQNISDSWKTLKETQLADPYLSNNTNLPKLQVNFEQNFLSKVGDAKNMNDLWQTTQAYDASVPARVKMANSMSSEVLQDQKAVWLQNRSVLADATHQVSTGLNQTAAKAYSDMSNMYTAKENILSKIKIDKTGGISKVAQWAKDNPWKARGVGLIVGDKVLKGVTGYGL